MKTLFIETISDFTKMRAEEDAAQESNYEYEVIIKDGVTAIPESAFKECLLLTRVSIPDSVKSIGDHAFEDCGIESIKIPDSVTSLGWQCFKSCHYLKYVRLSANIKEIPCECFAGALKIQTVIPYGVTEISSCAFECTQIKTITIPDTVTKIGDGAFSKCSFLTDIKLSKNISAIPYKCFENCHRLETLDIPEGVTEINSAFKFCRSLSEIKIPDSVTKIAWGAFDGTCIYPTCVPERFRNEETFYKGDLRTFGIIND